MRSRFPLFQSHLDLSKKYWNELLENGDIVIDATCGNGKDSLALAQMILPNGFLYAIDIQSQAIESSKALLRAELNPIFFEKIEFYCLSHENFDFIKNPVKAVIYNLGYLPGGNKSIQTRIESTLRSVEKALSLILPGGFISITCYPGHFEGQKEEDALLDFCRKLDPKLWNICYHCFINRKASPNLLLLQKHLQP